MELFAGVFEFVAFLVATRRGVFTLVVVLVLLSLAAALISLISTVLVE